MSLTIPDLSITETSITFVAFWDGVTKHLFLKNAYKFSKKSIIWMKLWMFSKSIPGDQNDHSHQPNKNVSYRIRPILFFIEMHQTSN
jgi:hypothetical protein